MRSDIGFTVPLEGLSKMERFVRVLSRAVTRSDLPFNGVTQTALGKDCRWGCYVQLQGCVLYEDIQSQFCLLPYVPWHGLCLPEGRAPFSDSHKTVTVGRVRR